ncbi:GH39 family glycosyl hydrolase [Laspinema olomoucense]|uniref:Glycosyl hydrolases family 39 N-terminal catalytic domain-containing protein n=1 Tax=Laspinema olomoucense D3b TaxID=2953688 RepID=A0ABT2N742_9CYAN|nr:MULTISPECIES: glycosyl hydrolase [unclassified Laspinema]MCT7972271.1 hypothetical protein [Laspinema sp. D3d]MCT7978407.1 hypothetical protein [Laspinema sp. D3b]
MLLNRIQRQVLTFLLFLGLATGMVVGLKSLSVERGVNLGQPETEIPATLFGMHLHHVATIPTYRTNPPITEETPWPSVPIPTWRLVAAYVDWFALEPRKGEWNFEILDKSLELAEKHQVEPLMYLGFSPRWASQRPDEPSAFGPGKAAPPQNIEDWRNYVRTVATRYKGRIHYYELWNEPNGYKRFYTGTISEMLELCREAYQILKEVDPTITVVSPSATGDWGSSPGVEWLDEFLSQGGGDYADVIGYHFYVMPGPPENMVPLIQKVKAVMAKHGQNHKPLWNTECSWLGDEAFFSEDNAAAYVARSYVLNWAAGVERLYWFAWDSTSGVQIHLTRSDHETLTPAGVAYAEVQKWLVGAQMRSCEAQWDQTWICSLERDRRYRGWIVWNPQKELMLSVPEDWEIEGVRDLTGDRHTGSIDLVKIGPTPILLENSAFTLNPDLQSHLSSERSRVKL